MTSRSKPPSFLNAAFERLGVPMSEPTKSTDEVTELDTSKHVDPNQDPSQEGTPIADELMAAASAPEDTADAPETAKSYKVDVDRALARETQDGKGDDDPGPSDWNGYATDGVEAEDQ